jgi:probable HAF family extracellular repeat protein
MTPIQPPPGDVALAILAINDRGVAVGSAAAEEGGGTAPTVYRDGAAAHLPGIAEGVAYAINDNGRIVGSASGLGPFLFVDGKAVSLGAEGGNAYAVNNADQVVGLVSDKAVLWTAGAATDLEALPGDGYSWASDINDRGEVVGSSGASSVTDGQAFLYTPSAGMTALGRLDAADAYSIALSINNCGHVVGTSGTNADLYATNGLRAFLFADGRMLDLNDLIPASTGVVLTAAASINDNEQIAGRGVVDEQLHAILLTPAKNKDRCTAPGKLPLEQER